MKRDTQPAGPPAGFLDKMRRLMPAEEYSRFLASYDQPAAVGLRVNTLKISALDFSTLSPFPLEPVGAYEPAGFRLPPEARPGRHPYHDAGLYYLQEPSAMVAGALLAPEPGELVLDLAAAPGGKSTHLAARLAGDRAAAGQSPLRRHLSPDGAAAPGLLVANDVHASRARLLAGNLARCGVAGSLVVNNEPEALAAAFGSVFDRVLVDAPCSGEGMFRRAGGFEWSERIVAACARRQTSILAVAAGLVRPGGRLLYSTCTFSPEEDERVIAEFLEARPDFTIVDPPRLPGYARGRPDWLPDRMDAPVERAVRLWPHLFAGEGHFMALMERSGAAQTHTDRLAAFPRKAPSEAERAAWRAFSSDCLKPDIPAERLHAAAGRLYLLPQRAPAASRLRLVRYGLPLGEVRGSTWRPSADLALALRAEDVSRAVDWEAGDPRLAAYLAGEDLSDAGPDGWTLACVDGFGLGWAKRVGERLKNHYPHGARRHPGRAAEPSPVEEL
jgi:16S rRNA C967 or C1407 C5-methylase (RsmB/RsmF family)/NOL1/NOP2/fmu family ribosome biogenesis protein